MERALAADATPTLMPIREAIEYLRLRGVTVPHVRQWISTGKLAATKAGRHYLVSPDDLRAHLAPKLRPRLAKPPRETEHARIMRQLAEAGMVPR